MYKLDDILKFVSENTGTDNVTAYSDIDTELGCTADDFGDLMGAFAKQYKIDMSTYLWYFHTVEEGHNLSIGRSFYKTPYELVTRIPVTPGMLLKFAQKGKWDIIYPEHKIPKRRYDILINQLLIVGLLLILICKWLIK